MKLFNFKWGHYNNRKWVLRQSTASASCCIMSCLASVCRTWMGTFSSELMSSNGGSSIDSSTFRWLVSMLHFSSAILSIPAGILADRWGRKRILLLTAPLSLLAWVLVAVSNNILIFYLSRVIQGSVDAIVLAVVPIYLTEMSSVKIRGAIQSSLALFFHFGGLYTYFISSYVELQTFIYISISLPIIFFITFIFMPESPYYYLMKKNKDEASKALSWLRASKSVEEELAGIQEAVNADMSRRGGFKDLFATKRDIRAFLIVQIVTATAMFDGMIPIMLCSEVTFNRTPLLWVTASQLGTIMGVTLLVTSLIPMFLSDTLGKRKLLIISSSGVTLINLTITLFYYLFEVQEFNVGPYVWVMYLGVLSHCFFSNIGAFQMIRGIQAEFFPSHTRAIGGGVTGAIASIELFIVVKLYLVLMDVSGVYLNFLIYSIIAITMTILIIKFVPESAGKTLDEINKTITNISEIRGRNCDVSVIAP